MSRTDAQRWADWRSNGERPFRERRRCECGQEFMPDLPRQELCRKCAGKAGAAERAPVTADEAEREKVLVLLRKALADDARHQPIPLAEPESDEARLRRKAKRRVLPPPPRRSKKTGHSNHKAWARIALRHLEAGWPLRKIAKRLGVPVEDVRTWAVLTADEMRFRAAADGKDRKPEATPPPERALGDLLWCYARQTGRCPTCRKTTFAGEKIALVDGRWTHASCAEELGYRIVDPDRRSEVRKRMDARAARS